MAFETTLLLLIASTFAAIGLLPLVFFDRDRDLNWRWCLTALPFFVAPLAVAAVFIGWLQPWSLPGLALEAMNLAGALTAILSIAVIAHTLGTHARPLALWHQKNDAPVEIVTWGAYRYVRHPFYSAFLLAFCAAFLAAPLLPTLACLGWGLVALWLTARREEQRLLASAFGEAYGHYLKATGRFLPRLMQESRS